LEKLTPPLSLPMMKIEKNFIAHMEKKYPRKPYEEYPIFNRQKPEGSLLGFVWREMIELNRAVDKLDRIHELRSVDPIKTKQKELSNQIVAAMWEVADVSNTLDYLFEGLLKEYTGLEDEIE